MLRREAHVCSSVVCSYACPVAGAAVGLGHACLPMPPCLLPPSDTTSTLPPSTASQPRTSARCCVPSSGRQRRLASHSSSWMHPPSGCVGCGCCRVCHAAAACCLPAMLWLLLLLPPAARRQAGACLAAVCHLLPGGHLPCLCAACLAHDQLSTLSEAHRLTCGLCPCRWLTSRTFGRRPRQLGMRHMWPSHPKPTLR